MYLKPCRNCPHKEGCDIKADKLASLRGLGFVSANFRCEKRLSRLPPGQRIAFKMGDGEYPYWEECTFTAVVMRPYKTRILVWITSCDGDSDVGLISRKNPIAISPDRVTLLGGHVKVCPVCGQPEKTRPDERKGSDGVINTFYCAECAGG